MESHDRPKVVITSHAEYENVVELRKQSRRQRALAKLQLLRQQVQARNRDLAEDESLALADRFTREVIEDMVAEGKIGYQGS